MIETKSPATFEQLLAAVGRKLDADPELQRLLSEIVVRLTGYTGSLSHDVAAVTEAPVGSEGDVITEADHTEPASEIPLAAPATPEDLSALVGVFNSGLTSPPAATAPLRPGGPAPLATIKMRLELKRRAIELARERAEARQRGEAVHATGQWFNEVIAQAKTHPNCYLWMCQTRHDNVSPAQWTELGVCFAVLLRAVGLVEELHANGDLSTRALYLLAEAQSMVRAACTTFDFEDADQFDIYLLLLQRSAAEQIYISRYMRADDPADPAKCRDLSDRIEKLIQEIETANAARQLRMRLLGKIRYEATRLVRNPVTPTEHWNKITSSVDQLITQGLPPSDAQLRGMLINHLDCIPDDLELPNGFKRFMSEVDAYLAIQQPSAAEQQLAFSAEVERVAAFLKGSELVMIGGECRNDARRSLIAAFGLSDLNWIATRPHETTSQFESTVARDNVKLVMLAIRWTSHSYGDVKNYCDKYSKPLVRLPRGYGVNQVAAEICNQCKLE